MSQIKQMEEREATTTILGAAVESHWWWAAASSAQLAFAIHSYRKGTSGTCSLMPLRAFFVSSLIIGSGGAAAMASLRASGVHTVEDMQVIGAKIGTAIRAPPRTPKDVG